MVRRGGYQTSAQREGKSAGQRKRRMARDRKRRLREQNLYSISVRTSLVSKARYDEDELGVYGIHEDDGTWVLTGMAVRRSVEKLVSYRQGATRSEVRDRAVTVPNRGMLDPRDGLRLSTFETKADAMNEIRAEASNRIDTGLYVVRASDCGRSMATYKVDRDDYHDWLRSRSVSQVRV